MAIEVDMTRGAYRRIYSGFRKGKRISSVSIGAEAWFWRLHCIVDQYGNHDADPLLCRVGAAPYRPELTDEQVAKWLDELRTTGLIKYYNINNDTYLHIVDFIINQPPGKNGKRLRCYPESPYEADEQSRCIQVHPGVTWKS